MAVPEPEPEDVGDEVGLTRIDELGVGEEDGLPLDDVLGIRLPL